MRRRALLASIASGAAALAGCFDQSGPGTATQDGATTTTQPTTTQPTSTPDASEVFVYNDALQYGVVVPSSPDSIGIAHERTQYYVIRLEGAEGHTMDHFALAIGDRTVAPTVIENLYHTRWGNDTWFGEEERSGLLAFEVPPTLPDGEARVTWPGGKYDLEDDVAARLGNPVPSWSATLSVPAELPGTHPFTTVTVEVTNEGDHPARFVGALNRQGPHIAYTPEAAVGTVVGAGAAGTVAVASDWHDVPSEERIGDGEPDVTYSLEYPFGDASATVRVVEGEGPTQTRTATK
jgi:hypothetical protein